MHPGYWSIDLPAQLLEEFFIKQKEIMKKNMGKLDRSVRLLIALVLIGVYFSGIVTGTWGIVILVAAGIMALTSLINSCPLYSVWGISTASKHKAI